MIKEKILLLLSKLMLHKKLIIIFIILIPLCIAIISLLLFMKQKNAPKPGIYVFKDNSAVTYSQKDVKKLQKLEQKRQPLDPADETVKIKLIERRTTLLAKTSDYKIMYNPLTDMFQAQITTVNIDIAKKEVVDWFTNQGMSKEALCRLPLSFTLDTATAQGLKGLDITFNPLAPGC